MDSKGRRRGTTFAVRSRVNGAHKTVFDRVVSASNYGTQSLEQLRAEADREDRPIFKEGFLHKRGKGGAFHSSAFRRRYFVVFDGCLIYYKHDTDGSVPKGVILLDKANITTLEGSFAGLRIETASNQVKGISEGRVYTLQMAELTVESTAQEIKAAEAQVDEWVKAIQLSINELYDYIDDSPFNNARSDSNSPADAQYQIPVHSNTKTVASNENPSDNAAEIPAIPPWSGKNGAKHSRSGDCVDVDNADSGSPNSSGGKGADWNSQWQFYSVLNPSERRRTKCFEKSRCSF